jgi:hypothetical protein
MASQLATDLRAIAQPMRAISRIPGYAASARSVVPRFRPTALLTASPVCVRKGPALPSPGRASRLPDRTLRR